ncbi:MAG: NAD kinase [Bacteroidetes bacterium]|nr:NAD kinase [Bacteroidota bacterium]MDA0903443.1 NAD kinase [Bacteroidota bacterium]MDA1241525.1 NAD kinase [Bacteroidota bacterium]
MRIAIFGKAVSPDDAEALRNALARVLSMDPTAHIAQGYLDELSDHMEVPSGLRPFEGEVPLEVDLLLAFGGDGTVLESATMVRRGEVPILGVNTGRLGFLSNVSMEAFDLAMDALTAGTTWIEERALLHVEVSDSDLGDFPYALNEVVIHKRDTASMVVVDVHRDEKFVNTYWADGLLVSTPTGSTAYSLSAGGPIVLPGSEVVVVTPVAPHNLNDRPLVVPLEGEITLVAGGRDAQFLLSMDSRSFPLEPGREVVIRPADFRIKLVNLEHQDFFSTVRQKMHWGLDPRER